MVAAGLSAVGITEDRAQAVARAAGFDDCGCRGRRESLNNLGRKVSAVFLKNGDEKPS